MMFNIFRTNKKAKYCFFLNINYQNSSCFLKKDAKAQVDMAECVKCVNV